MVTNDNDDDDQPGFMISVLCALYAIAASSDGRSIVRLPPPSSSPLSLALRINVCLRHILRLHTNHRLNNRVSSSRVYFPLRSPSVPPPHHAAHATSIHPPHSSIQFGTVMQYII